MSTTITTPLKINGVLSTDKTVWQNMNALATASLSFLTYDNSLGKWAVVINKTGSSVRTFDDTNIIGSLSISESGVNELYNGCSIEFPHKSIRDQTDFIEVSIPAGDRFANEVTNVLQIQNELINDPATAAYIASVELKQSRLSKIVTFNTDFRSVGLLAGDLIAITNTMYGWSTKLFRVMKVEETDEDVIGVTITAQEYDANIYSTAGLTVSGRTKSTGIQLKEQNTEVQKSNDADIGNQLKRLLVGNVVAGFANSLLNKLFNIERDPVTGKPTGRSKAENAAANDIDKILSGTKKPNLETITRSAQRICEGQPVTITVAHTCTSCFTDIPPLDYAYTITGISSTDINIPLTGNVTVTNGTGTLTFTAASDAVVENFETAAITIGNLSTTVEIYDQKDYTYTITRSAASITEGSSVTFNITATGSKASATIPYAITGSATGKVTTPLTGNITTVAGSASLTVNTTDDSVYQGTQGITFTLEPALQDPCGTVGTNTSSVTIFDNENAPINCQFAQVPLVWCPEYNGNDFQCTALNVTKYAYLPLPLAGEASVSVPLTVSVTKGNPSTVTVLTTVNVASSTALGGAPLQVIKTFNTIAPKGLVTGTTQTFYGYF